MRNVVLVLSCILLITACNSDSSEVSAVPKVPDPDGPVASDDYLAWYEEIRSLYDTYERFDLDFPLGQYFYVYVVIDYSRSMTSKVDKIWETVQNLTELFPEGTHVSMIIFGHIDEGSPVNKIWSCANIDYIRNMHALQDYVPGGWSPLAGALKSFIQFVKSTEKMYHNIIYVIGDGFDTCGDDPLAAIQGIRKVNEDVIVNTVGIGYDVKSIDALQRLADAGGGLYVPMEDITKLRSQFLSVYKKWSEDLTKHTVKSYSNVAQKFIDHKRELGKFMWDSQNPEHMQLQGALSATYNDVRSKIYEEDKRIRKMLYEEIRRLSAL